MVFPFTDGGTIGLTVGSVLLLTGASVVHVAVTRGLRSMVGLLVVAGGGGMLAETIGVRTGFPFGSYDYTGSLGAQVLGVPVLVPVAWTMMAYPALLVARRLTAGRASAATVAVAAWALTSWDVFLDPQMVDAGHWRWHHPEPSLPGVHGVPLTNFAGWLLVALLMSALLNVLIAPADPLSAVDLLPYSLFLWTFASSVLANAVFFGRPPVALVGGLLMGVVAVPLAVRLARARRML